MLPTSGNIGLRQIGTEYGVIDSSVPNWPVALISLLGVWGDVPAVAPIRMSDFYGKGRRVENWLTPYGNEGAFDQSPYYVFYSGLADDSYFPVYWFASYERTSNWCYDLGAMDEGYNAGNGSDYVWTWLQTESWTDASFYNQFANATFFLDNNVGYRADYPANHYGWYDVAYGSNGVGCYDGYEEYGGVGMWWYDSYINTGDVYESGGYYW